MENALVGASSITAIVLAFIGILKLPFKTFKEKHPKAYKVVFTLVSLVLSLGLPVIAELYIIGGSLASEEFVVLLATTVGGVFSLYNGVYEGLGLKDLAKVIATGFGTLFTKFQDSKLEKTVKKVGLEKLTEISKKIAAEEEAKKVAEKEKTATATTTTTKVNEIKF